MYKKVLNFLLILCLCMGVMANTNVYAMELQGNTEGTFFAMDDSETAASEESEIVIPQNGAEVCMEGVEAQPATFSLRAQGVIPDKRYTLLLLDNSMSRDFLDYNGAIMYTADTALPYVKEAAKKFLENIKNDLEDNYIAIVSYGDNKIISEFTDDEDSLLEAIDSLYNTGEPNVYNGFTLAEQLIDSISDENAIKNVILFTTGMTSGGEYSYTGHYNSSIVGGNWQNTGTGVRLYAYANSAYAAAEALKEKCTIYTIGLFNTLEDMPEQGRNVVQFFKLCACDWASSQERFYDVKNPEELEFVFGQVAESIIKRTGKFSYPGTDKDFSSTYYYDDNYFNNTSYDYNPHLATMSLCLELSSWGSEEESDYTKKMKNAEALLDELGFVGFDHNYTDFTEEGINGKPTKDSVGVVAANKHMSFDDGDYTLIAVAVRGGGYEREWASNFKIGLNGEHRGFSEARDIVVAFLENYIEEQGISGNIKLWITGYSRAAATANLVAAAIDDGNINLGGCTLALDDMFAYTFETPAGAIDTGTNDTKYNNIFNTINMNDLVPKVAPEYWGFSRYGIDCFLSTPETDGYEVYQEKLTSMLEMYQKLEGYEGYDVDDFKMKKIAIEDWKPSIIDDNKDKTKQSAFLNSYVTMLAKDFLKNRAIYVTKYQNGICDACGIFFGTDSAKTTKLFECAKEKFTNNWKSILLEFLSPFGGEEAAYRKVAEYLKECLDEAGITNYSQGEFNRSVTMILDLVVAVAANHPNLATTLVFNFPKIGQAHYPELCLAWVQSMDTNYTAEADASFSTGKYRIVRINCPVDVIVYDTGGNSLASIVDDTPQPDADVVAVFNDDGEKMVYLPINHDYVVKLTATDEGIMNYAVQEYDPNVGETNHMVLFNDIEIANGQEYTAYLPGYSKEDIENRTGAVADTDYTLFLGETQILPSEELAGEEVFNAYYNANAVVDDAAKGIVFGSGIRQYGTFAKITAIPYEGYEFVGWYEGEDLVSTEAEYRFRVSKDSEFMAVFKEISQEKPSEESTEESTEESAEESTEESTQESTEDSHEGNIEGMFRVVTHWNTGLSGEITLTNTGAEVIHDWVVAFDLPYDIVDIWNGTIVSYENGVYTVQNAEYNWDINPGESVTFGFIVNAETETIVEPTYYELVEKTVNTVIQDYKIAYEVNSDWETAFNGQIEISNESSEEIVDWVLEFDSNHSFSEFWDAEIVSHEGNHYVIKNKGYNARIGAGETLALGFEAICGSAGSSEEPYNYNLIKVDMD